LDQFGDVSPFLFMAPLLNGILVCVSPA
jgi:hypothetical protein